MISRNTPDHWRRLGTLFNWPFRKNDQLAVAIGERNEYLRQRDIALGERNEYHRQRDIALLERDELRREIAKAQREPLTLWRPTGDALHDLARDINAQVGQLSSVFFPIVDLARGSGGAGMDRSMTRCWQFG
jgi:hypothetical protein